MHFWKVQQQHQKLSRKVQEKEKEKKQLRRSLWSRMTPSQSTTRKDFLLLTSRGARKRKEQNFSLLEQQLQKEPCDSCVEILTGIVDKATEGGLVTKEAIVTNLVSKKEAPDMISKIIEHNEDENIISKVRF